MNVFETKRIRLISRSPIHIGSVEQKITPFEYIEHKGYIYYLSEDNLSEFLLNTGILNLFLSRIQTEGHKFRIHNFLKENNISLTEDRLLRLSSRRIKLIANSSNLTEFRPTIRDGFNKIYIPGTSIKGVIRTSILYKTLKEYKKQDPTGFKKQIEEKISRDIDKDRRKRNRKNLFKWGNEKWLEGFVLGEDGTSKKETPHTDWLRMLHVSDAYPVKDVETVLIPVNVLKNEGNWIFKEDRHGKKITIWIEAIPKNTVLEFDITWDNRLLEEFKKFNKTLLLPSSLSSIIDTINEWAQDVFEFEKNFSRGSGLDKWYEMNKSNFRIGFGSGMVSTTIAILLDPELRKKVRNYAGLNRGKDTAPKSRRVWVQHNSLIPLGWAVVEVV